jgi:uncharacterized protein YciI
MDVVENEIVTLEYELADQQAHLDYLTQSGAP